MAERNLDLERAAIDTFNQKEGRLPTSSTDWSEIHKMAYPTGIPAELQSVTSESATGTMADTTTPTSPDLTGTPTFAESGTALNQREQELNQARQQFNQLVGPNAFYHTAQRALQAKVNAKQQPIGESQIFKQAGVGGFGALSQSLNTRANELKMDRTELMNLATTMAGEYKDMYNAAAVNLETLANQYEAEANRLHDLEMATYKHKLDMDYLQAQSFIEQGINGTFPTDDGSLSPRAQAIYDNPDLLDSYSLEERGKIVTEIANSGLDTSKLTIPGISGYKAEMMDRTLSNVDELVGRVDMITTGLLGEVGKKIPGTPAYDFAADLDTLKSNIAFNELTAMREASKTGGALGQVSDREGQLLESALGALKQGQSVNNLKKNLLKIKDSVQRWKDAVEEQSGSTTTNNNWDSVDWGNIDISNF